MQKPTTLTHSATKVYVQPRSGFHPHEVANQFPSHPYAPNEPGDASRYGILTDKTPYRHYAWEFLRRNRFFQLQLDHPNDTRVRGDELYWGFQPSNDRSPRTGLSEIVHYSRAYISKTAEKKWDAKPVVVQWEIATDMFSRLTAPKVAPSRSVELEYQESQVAVVFDLVSLGPGIAAIDFQLEIARSHLVALAAARGIQLTKHPSTPNRAKLRNLLRIVDLFSSPEEMTVEEVTETYYKKYKTIHETQPGDKITTKKSSEGHVRELSDRAFAYVYGREYLHLLSFDVWPWIDVASESQV